MMAQCNLYQLKVKTSSNLQRKKDKANPLQASTGPEGFRRLKLPYFKIINTQRW
jgi:hypothetical protein